MAHMRVVSKPSLKRKAQREMAPLVNDKSFTVGPRVEKGRHWLAGSQEAVNLVQKRGDGIVRGAEGVSV